MIAQPLNYSGSIAGLFVGRFRSSETVVGLQFSPLLSVHGPLHSPLDSTYPFLRPEPSDGDRTVQKPLLTPQTLTLPIKGSLPFHFWQQTDPSSKSACRQPPRTSTLHSALA